MIQMRTPSYSILLLCLFVIQVNLCGAQDWKAKWITMDLPPEDTTNIWMGFAKQIDLDEMPKQAVAKIAVDSKYWLYINGELVVFEGGLKRGPNRNDTYFDEVDIAPFLRPGKNLIAVKLWYFGKPGFSHNDSGKPGMLFDLQEKELTVLSDASWKVQRLSVYQTAGEPHTNFRLPESSIVYDARLADDRWITDAKKQDMLEHAQEIGLVGNKPWNTLVKRPIPMWKDFGVKGIATQDMVRSGDTLKCKLPYNMQFTPVIALRNAEEGEKITLATDNYYHFNGGAEIVRAEYVTKKGEQRYEHLGWMNGHYLYILLPENMELDFVGYRETGYDTEFKGAFTCSDDFFNRLWEKARRTLYITMRDSYMDCPDRERAQWTGDAVLEAEEAFYALDTSSHALGRKWLHELVDWQKADGSLPAPVPANNWGQELPVQALASIGYYGLWMYYLHSGDIETIRHAYPNSQRYLGLWEFDESGLVKIRDVEWQWGDWGENIDMRLLHNLWYYLALQGQELMAKELGYQKDAEEAKEKMTRLKSAFNKEFWHNGEYRDSAYTGLTDDRVHALAIVSGIAEEPQYAEIEKVFDTQLHASPYMEKYVFEAMYRMGIPEKANRRHEKRFSAMVSNDAFSTLFEGWGIGKEGFGGGTVNHAWSGGGLSILSGYMAGIRPLKPGYEVFMVEPKLGKISEVHTVVPSVKGDIKLDIQRKKGSMTLQLVVPENSQAQLVLSSYPIKTIQMNDGEEKEFSDNQRKGNPFILEPGSWSIELTMK